MNKNKHRLEIQSGKGLHLFFIRKYPGHLVHPRRLSIIGCVLKPDAIEGAFQCR